MTRLEEIEARLAEIPNALESDGADLDAIEKEVRGLKDERKAINEAAEKREALLKEVAAGTVGNEIRTFKEDVHMETRTFAVDSAEYRSAYLRNLQGKELSVEERAAVTASAAIPTQTMNQIVGRLDLVPTIAAVDLMYIPGNVTFPVEGTVNDASWVAMGTAATDSADTLTSVSLAAYKLIKTVEVTADVMAMSIDSFENWLVTRLANKIAKAVDAAIYTGTGSSQAKGILTTISSPTGTFTKAGMTYKDLMTIIAGLGTAYLPNATFAMPRTLFYKEVLGMTTTSGDRVVVADAQSPAKFNIMGYPVIIDDNITADNVLFGDFKEYKFNFAQAPTVTSDTSVAFRTGSTVYRAMALADGKLADENAFVRYNRASA